MLRGGSYTHNVHIHTHTILCVSATATLLLHCPFCIMTRSTFFFTLILKFSQPTVSKEPKKFSKEDVSLHVSMSCVYVCKSMPVRV